MSGQRKCFGFERSEYGDNRLDYVEQMIDHAQHLLADASGFLLNPKNSTSSIKEVIVTAEKYLTAAASVIDILNYSTYSHYKNEIAAGRFVARRLEAAADLF